jgi:hypothetical protein
VIIWLFSTIMSLEAIHIPMGFYRARTVFPAIVCFIFCLGFKPPHRYRQKTIRQGFRSG